MKNITVALAGNPNSGKTSIFNMLTGAHQHVANYPGVTVEKKEGFCEYKGYQIIFVDLPGTYSLTAYSEEEIIARNFLIGNKPDVVVDIVDASNIERNLYLFTQLMELNVPLVLVFNMSDVAKQRGIVFDITQLEKLLETKIVETVANKEFGRTELLESIVKTAQKGRIDNAQKINFGPEIEQAITKIEAILDEDEKILSDKYGRRWLAIKLLEQDCEILAKVTSLKVISSVNTSVALLKSLLADEPEIMFADRRYGFISGACQETIKSTIETRHNTSDIIDTVVTNRFLGLPIFLLSMYIVFFLTFKIGKYPMGWLEHLFEWLATQVAIYWPAQNLFWLKSLIVDGVIAGVGGVIVFLPNILLLFLAIALLEDSGYMARAAFVMDRIMHKIGLHGKSFIPMLIGFGCSVPAIMATRILENKRNRITTIMVIPLISCGARLTIYGLIIPAFFPENMRGPVLWLIYIIGILLAVIAIKLLSFTVLKGDATSFVMELPPYHMPTFKAISIHMWQRCAMYLRKAGTVILAISIFLWAASNYPKPDRQILSSLSESQQQKITLENSIIGKVGKTIEPLIKPLGFDWKIGTALIGAAAAKEVFVSQLSIVYSVGSPEENIHTLRQKLQAAYSPLIGFCIMLYCLIATPCVATFAMTRQETGSWFWPIFQYVSLTVIAYILTFAVYQVGMLFYA